MKLPYVTSFILSVGTWVLEIKVMVSVPVTRPSFSPWARRPNSFAADVALLNSRPSFVVDVKDIYQL